jgi:pentose-5-phosphate-3-epimerase
MPNASIVPAVLEKTTAAVQRRINIYRRWKKPTHLDIVDQSFAKHGSFGPPALARLTLPPKTAAHLMVQRPEQWAAACWQAGVRRLIVHVESDISLPLIRQLSRRFSIVLALRLSTRPAALQPYRSWLDGVQVMMIRLGRQDAPFVPAQLNILRAVRRMFPTKPLIADGAMNERTIPAAVMAGATEIVVGSALKRSPQPRHTFDQLTRLVQAHRR